MFVLTIDQRASRSNPDHVPELLEDLTARLEDDVVLLPFVRTVGDEVQGVLSDPVAVVDLVLHLARTGGWSVGVGAGAGELASAADGGAPASSGAAFVHARTAVERAKGRTVANDLAVHADDAVAAARAEAVLQLLASVVRRRTATQWRALDLLERPGATGVEVAAALGVTPQNVSKLGRDALWQEEQDARAVAAHLLLAADPAWGGPRRPSLRGVVGGG
ncbi:hypothetical protein C8046_02565 [Serinibacter arcticus]|uniref:SatD family (SatD) n=1 Tax=Serinibacter arcticus TaxID=1655435 RepID=A0A2U1ZRY5_9MICO|nr:hypothetical protein [Serinibacter arcticus]PWD49749.1 hypothetical protein C8046_02565 [Serinibacter arcticus]